MNLRCEQAVKFFIIEKFEFKRFRKELFNFFLLSVKDKTLRLRRYSA